MNQNAFQNRDVTVTTFDWTVSNFRNRMANEKCFKGDHFVFMNDRFRWSAVQTPAPNPENRIMINNLDLSHNISFCSMSLVHRRGWEHQISSYRPKFDEISCIGLFDEKIFYDSGFLTNGQLHVRCRMEARNKNPNGTLGQDLAGKDLPFSDFTLVVGEKEFKVHRVILASRSPVFRAMFAMGDMAESITGRTVVEDVNPDDMESFLEFVYTDSIEANKMKPGVLQLADKYEVPVLFKKCCCHLANTLSINNAIEIFLLAYFISDASDLKMAAMKFIIAHYHEIKQETPAQMAILVGQHPSAFQQIFECLNDRTGISYVKKESM